MTFKETDFPAVLKQINKICQEEKNPAAAVEIIQEMIRIYEQIPLYPGLVNQISNAIEEEVDSDQLSPGDNVTFKAGGEFFLGRIASINDQTVTLDQTIHTESKGTMEIELNKFSECRRINTDALQQEWPELYFEDDN